MRNPSIFHKIKKFVLWILFFLLIFACIGTNSPIGIGIATICVGFMINGLDKSR
jgi:hypothetical protein